MQKLINALAVISFGVSSAIVAGGAYIVVNQEEIKAQIKEQVMEQVSGMVQGQLGQVLFGGSPDLPGADLPDPTRFDETGAAPLPVVPF